MGSPIETDADWGVDPIRTIRTERGVMITRFVLAEEMEVDMDKPWPTALSCIRLGPAPLFLFDRRCGRSLIETLLSSTLS